ncbi:MAG TPA: CheR family methyltransferase, partial [Geobacterales bacterium]|nr:CheR family methyltransferase [Geobacterales bacterium]
MRNVTPLHMLVINDHGTLCHSLSPLSVAGDRVTCAPTADQGVELARNEPFDLIVVDLDRCGNKENSFIAQRIKRAAHTPYLPVIVVSNDPDDPVQHQFFDLIPRPLDLERVRTDISIIRYRKRGTFVVPPLEDDHFKEFQKFIAVATALRFEERNRYQLERALANRMQLLRIDSHADYFTYLSQHGEDRQELDRLILHLTVGETSFFRYPAQFQILRQSIIPTLAKRSSTEPIRIWSAGCSTGEEPYSLAITLMEALPDWRQRTIEILATDINHEALRRAREGFYGSRTLRRTDKTLIDRYFEPHGDDYRVRQELRDLVTFCPLNLSTDPFPAP